MAGALRRVPLFSGLTDGDLQWVAERGSEKHVRAGEVNGREGEPVEHLYVILEGELRITKKVDGGEVVLNVYTPGTFFAEVPLLAGTPFLATGRALTDCRLFLLPDETFRHMLTANPAFSHTILETMAQRVKILQSVAGQRERLNSLSTLAAGLAHELNNPAAAARRAVRDLREESLKAQRLALAHDERFTPAQREHLEALGSEITEGSGAPVFLDTLERSDREDELADWLEDHGVEDGFELAPTLVSAGLDVERLDALTEKPDGLRAEALAGALEWLGITLNLATLADEVGQSTGRISELVRAMKEYSYMDKTAMREVDVREGLESTLTVLTHKLKKGVSVEKEYAEGLPRICANGGELNQVWTNIVDNAVDAMHGHGNLKVKTSRDDGYVLVEISDDGPGIPREAKNRIFEPFYTTKGVGEGTGLGLDIVRRIVAGHGGEIRVDSAPGKTTFKVRLPVDGPRRGPGNEANGETRDDGG